MPELQPVRTNPVGPRRPPVATAPESSIAERSRTETAPAIAAVPPGMDLRPAGNAPLIGGLRGTHAGVAVRSAGAQAAAAAGNRRLAGPLHVDGRVIRDAQGRQVVLRGVNVGSKAPPFLPLHTDADVRELVEETGVNFVRMFISWRAIEPEPLKYDEEYLRKVTEAVERFNRAGVYVLLDMHQDVWGGELASHGAPDWASLGRDEPDLGLPEGLPWAASYLEPKTWKSFEAFWNDDPVPETGIPIQTHYARAFSEVAKRMKGKEGVLGYDLMNEPFVGSELGDGLRGLLGSGFWNLAEAGLSAVGAWLTFGDPADAFQGSLQSQLRDPEELSDVLEGLRPAIERFETRLSRFYANVGTQIRRHDPDRPLFIEPVAVAGIGAPSALPHPGLDNLVYAPHLYDVFVDSGGTYDGNPGRMRRALRRHVDAARTLNLPLVVGEYGHITSQVRDDARYTRDVAKYVDQEELSAAYWEHRPGDEDDPAVRRLLARPYPQRVAGRLTFFKHDPATQTLKVTYYPNPELDAPTVISAPRHLYPNGIDVEVHSGVDVAWTYDANRGQLVLEHGQGENVRFTVRPRAR